MDFEQESKFGRIYKVAGPRTFVLTNLLYSGYCRKHEWI